MELAAVVWLGLCILVGVLAARRGRLGFGWGMLSVVFSPVLIGLLVLVLPDRSAAARAAADATPTPATHARCAACRELVRDDAARCKHCGTPLLPHSARPAGPGEYGIAQRDNRTS
ncbi:MAG: hypothetical protein MUC86_13525 [Burkholderiaceae bacterium]|jgi:uncharacterized paraquat-inducible protein A|nr:hypothetical protein [Burkholderiaceae bacterium]